MFLICWGCYCYALLSILSIVCFCILPELPPLCVVSLLGCLPTEHTPSPLVHQVAERDKGEVEQSCTHHEVYVTLWNDPHETSMVIKALIKI